jgi:WD40 repeat protein
MSPQGDVLAAFTCVHAPTGQDSSHQYTSAALWNIKTGQQSGPAHKITANVYCCSFSADGQFLASGGSDGHVHIWRVCGKNGLVPQVAVLQGPSISIYCVAWSPDGRFLAAGDSKGGLKLVKRDDESMSEALLAGNKGHLLTLAFHPAGNLLACGSRQGKVTIWDLSSPRPKLLQNIQAHNGAVSSIAWSPNGDMLASASQDKSVRLWSASGEEKGTWNGHTRHNQACRCQEFNDDNGHVFIRDPECTVQGHFLPVTCIAFSPDGQTLCACYGSHDYDAGVRLEEQAIRFWDVTHGRETFRLHGPGSPVVSVMYIPNSNFLVAGMRDAVRIWDASCTCTATATDMGVTVAQGGTAHVYEVLCMGLSPDGRTLATCSGPPPLMTEDNFHVHDSTGVYTGLDSFVCACVCVFCFCARSSDDRGNNFHVHDTTGVCTGLAHLCPCVCVCVYIYIYIYIYI